MAPVGPGQLCWSVKGAGRPSQPNLSPQQSPGVPVLLSTRRFLCTQLRGGLAFPVGTSDRGGKGSSSWESMSVQNHLLLEGGTDGLRQCSSRQPPRWGPVHTDVSMQGLLPPQTGHRQAIPHWEFASIVECRGEGGSSQRSAHPPRPAQAHKKEVAGRAVLFPFLLPTQVDMDSAGRSRLPLPPT